MASSPDLASLGIDDFAAHLGADFEMQVADGVVPLKLVKVDPAGNSGRAGGAFSLIFVAPRGPGQPQAIGQTSGARHHGNLPGAGGAAVRRQRLSGNIHVEHDPEKWEPVFRKDHAQTKDKARVSYCIGR
jgi:hypothetical protein